jgi:hypothetical protein
MVLLYLYFPHHVEDLKSKKRDINFPKSQAVYIFQRFLSGKIFI